MHCQKCGSPNIVPKYDYEAYRQYMCCMMCGKEVKDSQNDGENMQKNMQQEDEAMNTLSPEKVELINKEIEAGTSVKKLMRAAGIAKETARAYLRKYYETTGKPRPENRGGMERKPENKGKPHPTCKVEGCDKWPVSHGLCTHHWSTEYRIRMKNGGPTEAPRNKEEKPVFRKSIPEETKAQAVKDFEALGPTPRADEIVDLAKKYNVSISTLYNWKSKAKAKEVFERMEKKDEPRDLPVTRKGSVVDWIQEAIKTREQEISALKLALEIMKREAT